MCGEFPDGRTDERGTVPAITRVPAARCWNYGARDTDRTTQGTIELPGFSRDPLPAEISSRSNFRDAFVRTAVQVTPRFAPGANSRFQVLEKRGDSSSSSIAQWCRVARVKIFRQVVLERERPARGETRNSRATSCSRVRRKIRFPFSAVTLVFFFSFLRLFSLDRRAPERRRFLSLTFGRKVWQLPRSLPFSVDKRRPPRN